jgi:hypothetical protein
MVVPTAQARRTVDVLRRTSSPWFVSGQVPEHEDPPSDLDVFGS